MTHFATIVLIGGEINPKDRAQVENAVIPLLAPYDENGEWFKDGSRWDWWVIGGRFTGLLDGYDPAADPINHEPCDFCEATGITTQAVADKYPAYQDTVGKECIQCRGSGWRVKWNLADHDGDVMPVEQIDWDKLPWTPGVYVTPNGEWHEQAQNGWWGTTIGESKEEDEWTKEFRTEMESYKGATAVVVDCHV